MSTLKIFLLLCPFIFLSLVMAQVPSTMSYQGALSDASGSPVADGDYTMTFRLYDSESSTSSIWDETQVVGVMDGLFETNLGIVTPLDLDFNVQYWLGITVGSSSELSPRIALTASAYSLNAQKVLGISNIFPSEGNVGIGTLNPLDGALHIIGGENNGIGVSSAALNGVRSHISSGGGYAAGYFTAENSGSYGVWAQSDDYDALYAWSQNSGSTAIRAIGSNGAYAGLFDGVVGINTSTPTNGMLDVAGIISSTTGGFRFPDGTIQTTAASGTGAGNTLDQAYDQGGAGAGRSINADVGPVNITGSGGLNVGGSIGIGTTEPTAKLDVIGIAESNTIRANSSAGGGYAAGNFTASGSGTYGIWAQSNDYDALYAWSQNSGSTAIRALGTDGAYAGLFDGVVGINTSNPENGMLEVTGSGFMSAIAANSSSQNTISSDCSSGGGYAAGHFSATGGGTYAIWATSSDYDAIYATAGLSYDAIFANGNITYTGSLTHESDIRLKENISPLENSLSKLMQLKVKSFYFKSDQQFAHVNFPKGKNFGFIAQEFEQVIPELVTDNINFSSGRDTGSEEESINYKGINYTELIPFLVQAIQEQQEMIDDLKAQVSELQDK